jgi:hypothetical protein
MLSGGPVIVAGGIADARGNCYGPKRWNLSAK